jgi:hypothetical protein
MAGNNLGDSALEGPPADEDLVHQDRKRVNIGCMGRRLAAKDFGRHVRNRAEATTLANLAEGDELLFVVEQSRRDGSVIPFTT